MAGTVLFEACCVDTPGTGTVGSGPLLFDTRDPDPSETRDAGLEVAVPDASLERGYILTG